MAWVFSPGAARRICRNARSPQLPGHEAPLIIRRADGSVHPSIARFRPELRLSAGDLTCRVRIPPIVEQLMREGISTLPCHFCRVRTSSRPIRDKAAWKPSG